MIGSIDLHLVSEITDVIYQTIFGKSRGELVNESVPYWDWGLVSLHCGVIDEVIRDYMTIEALTALNHAEASVAMGIRNQAQAGQVKIDVADYCRQYRLEGKLWEFDANAGL